MFPDWLPNVHPLVIHFPLVLLALAVVGEWVDLLHPVVSGRVIGGLYALAAVAAGASYWTGVLAADTVFVPGMAHPLIDDHRTWALRTTVAAIVLAMAHIVRHLRRNPQRKPMRGLRLAMAFAGLAVALAMYQTAERGGRLVYEQGVGVIAGPGTR